MIIISHNVLIIILNCIFFNVLIQGFQPIKYITSKQKGNVAALHRHLVFKSENLEGTNNIDLISNELLSNDISYIKIVPATKLEYKSPNEESFDGGKFSSIFRHSAPYISMHRGSIMVIHLSGATISNREVFDGVMDDISILHLLGIKLVLVAGVREQLDKRITESGLTPSYSNGMRITGNDVY